ncbi:hypothetical protein F441_06198 [Phytophthora nicotianae CJ01A1]|uniref:Uncharacterized protein n=6 Tax=Phytophthora nicotianae TaxID=4792 RepID=W2RAV6_PHYN3|nr:hypothetical protein PPTG_20909 [Phytophthora nicotianae INRA-310]ETI50222.1 hypothetical protein F443_06188 [Phytophthora nicotianae P1569]ETK90092.1 hypothetical protein L915_06065 [Phytophthora nicotianae]ETO78954.1 hypothetical protein F444_06248 [Phytophthora nicotianae P1976]ETP19986.1 hypothetical protein F441_06198 [Phytophthora nicotianae CJ01A1]ETP47965.1 hypothetical protein F442_06224 [Phytophthora nicotianae P10297]
MDPFTTEWALKIQGMLKKWGTTEMELRFKAYTDVFHKNRIKEKIERLQVSLEDW